jgi:hypothetical protein
MWVGVITVLTVFGSEATQQCGISTNNNTLGYLAPDNVTLVAARDAAACCGRSKTLPLLRSLCLLSTVHTNHPHAYITHTHSLDPPIHSGMLGDAGLCKLVTTESVDPADTVSPLPVPVRQDREQKLWQFLRLCSSTTPKWTQWCFLDRHFTRRASAGACTPSRIKILLGYTSLRHSGTLFTTLLFLRWQVFEGVQVELMSDSIGSDNTGVCTPRSPFPTMSTCTSTSSTVRCGA